MGGRKGERRWKGGRRIGQRSDRKMETEKGVKTWNEGEKEKRGVSR